MRSPPGQPSPSSCPARDGRRLHERRGESAARPPRRRAAEIAEIAAIAAIAAIDTVDAVRERQRRMRTWFAEKLGPMPPKAERPPRITGEIDCDGYRVQKVIYETWPDQFVTAAFYLPDGPGPFPGVLLPCGHSDAAKAAEPYQAASILLARHGFAVLCFDPIGQGERRQFPDRDWGSYPSLDVTCPP